jgi:hypothetical protein
MEKMHELPEHRLKAINEKGSVLIIAIYNFILRNDLNVNKTISQPGDSPRNKVGGALWILVLEA